MSLDADLSIEVERLLSANEQLADRLAALAETDEPIALIEQALEFGGEVAEAIADFGEGLDARTGKETKAHRLASLVGAYAIVILGVRKLGLGPDGARTTCDAAELVARIMDAAVNGKAAAR